MKTTPFIYFSTIVLILFSGCSNDIDIVKNGVMKFNKTTTLGAALDNWNNCEDKNWESIEKDNGARIVLFECTERNPTPKLKNILKKYPLEKVPKKTLKRLQYNYAYNKLYSEDKKAGTISNNIKRYFRQEHIDPYRYWNRGQYLGILGFCNSEYEAYSLKKGALQEIANKIDFNNKDDRNRYNEKLFVIEDEYVFNLLSCLSDQYDAEIYKIVYAKVKPIKRMLEGDSLNIESIKKVFQFDLNTDDTFNLTDISYQITWENDKKIILPMNHNINLQLEDAYRDIIDNTFVVKDNNDAYYKALELEEIFENSQK